MILLVIILLFIILSIIWYLVVRDVDVETFPENDNQMTLKFKNKYLQAERGKVLKLGHNKGLARFLIIDNNEYPDGIQLESVEYPGYLVCYRQGRWHLQSQYYIKKSRKSVFIPIGIKSSKNRFGLVNLYNQNCLTVKDGRLSAKTYRSYPKKNQLFSFIPF